MRGLGTVYGLFTEEGALVYVGATNGAAHSRWVNHEAAGHDGLAVRVLERCAKGLRFKRERWWIDWAMGNGVKLMNKADRWGRVGSGAGSPRAGRSRLHSRANSRRSAIAAAHIANPPAWPIP